MPIEVGNQVSGDASLPSSINAAGIHCNKTFIKSFLAMIRETSDTRQGKDAI
jgi:hypothetical protein